MIALIVALGFVSKLKNNREHVAGFARIQVFQDADRSLATPATTFETKPSAASSQFLCAAKRGQTPTVQRTLRAAGGSWGLTPFHSLIECA